MVKKIILLAAVLAVLALLALTLMPAPVRVSVTQVEKGYFAEYVEDEGVTWLRHTVLVSAPIDGYLLRVEQEPGDLVRAGDVLFYMESLPAPALDPRARQQARDSLESALARERSARADHERALYRMELAGKELERNSKLFAQEIISRSTLDRVRNDFDLAAAQELSAREIAVSAGYEVENARALLEVAAGTRDREKTVVEIKALAEGQVLRRHRHQEGVIRAGEAILEKGRLEDLEARIDLLSVEAVRVRPGMKVILEHWGEKRGLQGKVRLVEPAGFTRVSALGVDEQRVPVFVEITTDRELWHELGKGYRVEARFILWEGIDVVFVPSSSLFRMDDNWYAFKIQDDRAVLVQVEPGRRSGLKTQILDGLEPGESVVTYPGDRLKHGIRVDAR